MSDSIAIFYEEHEAVEEQLRRLEQMLPAPEPAGMNAVIGSLEADLDHHLAHEEQALFPLLERYLPRDRGPIAVMLLEHAELRQRVGNLRRAFDAWRRKAEAREGGGAAHAGKLLTAAARQVIELLRMHIAKEDQILFPLARRFLSAAEIAELQAHLDGMELKQQKQQEEAGQNAL